MTEDQLRVGDLIENRYRVLSVIGSGGMGTLYRVSDEARDGRVIALKTVRLDTRLAESPESAARFRREFRLLTQLQHPNLVSVYDYGITAEGKLYFTMECIEGQDLEPGKHPLKPATIIPVIVQICRALAYLHARGVIHGDLKPSNILMVGDAGDLGHRAKIVDFGVALETRTPEVRARYYTPGYSAPEVKEQHPVDYRADLYSLGALWYALLLGEPPMFMPGAERLIQFSLEEALEAQDLVPAELGKVITRLLATSPTDRYASANEVVQALNEITGSAYELETRETASSYALRTHFVNRETELEVLQTVWKEAQDSAGMLVLLSGESGVGKTRLVAELELQAELEGARVVWGQCVERGSAYQPWREVLQVLVRYVEGEDEGMMQQVGPVLAALLPELWERDYMAGLAPAADLDPQAAQLRLNDGIVRVMRAAAGLRSTVVVVENAHWADEATLELLRYLARVPGAAGLLVCVTYRDDEVGPEHPLEMLTGEQVMRIRLCRLSPQVTTDLVRAMLGLEQLPALLTERVQQTTGGNALFVQELIRSLAAEGQVLHRTVGGWQVDGQALREAQLPESIRQVVERRLAQLSTEAREALEWAAVVGMAFWEGSTAEVGQAARAQVRAALGELLDLGLIAGRDETSFVGEREYLFFNPTVREVSYEGIPWEERREAHNRVAAWLLARSDEELDAHLGLIAEHLEGAGQIEPAITYLTRAGEQAAARFANAEAVRYLSRALDLLPENEWARRYDILSIREKVCDLQGTREAQEQDLTTLKELAEALDDAHRRIEVALRRAHYTEMIGNYPASIEAIQEAISLAQEAQNAGREAAGRLQWGRVLWHQGRYEASQTQLEQALTLARAAGLHRIEADSLHNIGIVSAYLGDRVRATAFWKQGMSLYNKIGYGPGEGQALSNLGLLAMRQEGNYVAGKDYLERCLRILRETGDRAWEGYALGHLGLLSIVLGDYAQAKSYLQQCLRTCLESDYRRGEATGLVYLSLLFRRLEDDKTAREHGQRALLIAQSIGDRDLQGRALTNLGHALAGLGQLAEAADAYERALAMRQESGQPNLAMEPLAGLARLSLAQGDLTQALTHAEEILSHLESNTLNGTDEPFLVHLTCYRALNANQDLRAEGVLNTAHSLLQEQAAKITNEALRRSFLENVPAHREILSAFTEQTS